MNKKILPILGAALLSLAILSGGGAALAAPQGASLRVVLLLDEPPGDAGPVDALKRGLEKAQAELGITASVRLLPRADGSAATAESMDALEQGFKEAAAQNDLVLLGSPALHEVLMNHAGNFRRARFGCIDGAVNAPNIASVTFSDAQAAFLSGAAAATLTTHTALPGINAERVLGWVGDYDTPPRRVEAEAFLQGARLVHPETRVLTVFTQSPTEDAGHAAALDLFAKGADIVAHSAGRAGLGVLRAAAEQQRWAIGHTSDQSTLTAQGGPSSVLFSQLHRADTAVFDLIKDAVEGRFPGGKEDVRGLATGGVGLTSLEPLRQKLGAAFPADLPQRLKELEFELRRESITLPKVQKKSLCDCL